MNKTTLLELLAEVQRGALTPEDASARLANLPFEDIGHTRIENNHFMLEMQIIKAYQSPYY